MQFSASIVAIVSLAASAMAGPISQVEARGLSVEVSLCKQPNLQECNIASIPIGTCYDATAFPVLSLQNKDHTCAYHTQPGCKGSDKHYRNRKESLPANVCIKSVRCW